MLFIASMHTKIDEQRFAHLNSNLDHFLGAADRSKVVIECTDSMKAIQQLANDIRPKVMIRKTDILYSLAWLFLWTLLSAESTTDQ